MNRIGFGCVIGSGVTRIVRPRHSNGSPVHACSITDANSSRSLPRCALSTPAISNSSALYPAATTVHSRPGAALSITAICSAVRTGSCKGNTVAEISTEIVSVLPRRNAAIVSGAGTQPSSRP